MQQRAMLPVPQSVTRARAWDVSALGPGCRLTASLICMLGQFVEL